MCGDIFVVLAQGVNVFSMTPGWVSTSIEDPLERSINRHVLLLYRLLISLSKYFFARTAQKGAETIIFCSVDSALEQSADIYFQ